MNSTRKNSGSRKNGDKDGKALYKLITNAVFGKTMEKLLFTDTDSLKYEIKTEDVYEEFSSNKKFLLLEIIRLS